MSIPVGLTILRMAEARRDQTEDMLHGWREEGTTQYMAIYNELTLARRGVEILETQLHRLKQYAPPEHQQQAQAPVQRIAPVRPAADVKASATG